MKVCQYGQWDHYPTGQGEDIVSFIRKKMDKKVFKKKVSELRTMTDEDVKKCWEDCGAGDSDWVSCDVSDKLRITFPQLSRDTGSGILAMIQNGAVTSVKNSADFANDSLFCEWAYVVDLDKNVLEVYRGFNTVPTSKQGRFNSSVNPEPCSDGTKYYPIKLLKKYKFKDLKLSTMSKLSKELDKEDNED
jgi:hypothetical protein